MSLTQEYIETLHFLASLKEDFIDVMEELEGTHGWWDGFCNLRWAA